MVTLSRRRGESIVVNDEIEFTILAIKSNSIKVGVKAPKSMNIRRKELVKQKGNTKSNDE